jgi:carboxyl-terminal processing protease
MRKKGTSGEVLWGWMRRHPLEAARRVLWVLFAFILGAVGGAFLAWGPLTDGWPLVVALGLAGGLLPGGLWARQQLAAIHGQTEVARRWRRGLLLGSLAILLAVASVVVVQLYRVGFFPPLTQDRVANFERLWRAMADYYPYFDLKGVDWEEVHGRYLPQVEAAQSDEEYFAAIGAMLAELNDAHTGLIAPRFGIECRFALIREVEGQPVVTLAGPTAQEVGLEQGAVVLAVDGRSVEETLAAVTPLLPGVSTPWHQRCLAFASLLGTPPDGVREVVFESPAGEQQTVMLQCIHAERLSDTGPLVVGERLSSGLGLIRIPTFGSGTGHDLVAEFDALMDAPGLILDLRGNGGGSTSIAEPMAGRFLGVPFTYARDSYRARLPQRGWRLWLEWRVAPRQPVYTGPVVLLIDTANVSTAQAFTVALVDSGRAQTVGRRTGGASGNPITFRLPGGGLARFSVGSVRRMDGASLEGVGIIPDVSVAWTIEDVRQGRDPDLEAAGALLSGGLSP